MMPPRRPWGKNRGFDGLCARYRLDENGVPVEEPDLFAWARWLEKADRVVAQTDVDGVAYVSTVFLGIDHDFTGRGPPILYETMIFESKKSGAPFEYQERYRTRAEAEAGHARAIEWVKQAILVKVSP